MLDTTNKEAVFRAIRSGKEGRDKVIKLLYHDDTLRSNLKAIIYKYSNNGEIFDHVLSTVLMQFIKTVIKREDLKVEATLYSYLGGIARFVVLNEIKTKNKKRTDELEAQYNLQGDDTPETLLIDRDKKDLIHQVMSRLGKNCKEVLMYWANGFKMIKIAEMMGYKSDGMAKKKKHQCFKQLLKFLNDNPQIKSILR